MERWRGRLAASLAQVESQMRGDHPARFAVVVTIRRPGRGAYRSLARSSSEVARIAAMAEMKEERLPVAQHAYVQSTAEFACQVGRRQGVLRHAVKELDIKLE
jgi:hypothetical protein